MLRPDGLTSPVAAVLPARLRDAGERRVEGARLLSHEEEEQRIPTCAPSPVQNVLGAAKNPTQRAGRDDGTSSPRGSRLCRGDWGGSNSRGTPSPLETPWLPLFGQEGLRGSAGAPTHGVPWAWGWPGAPPPPSPGVP